MEFYAAIDTNVLISALLSKNEDSPTVKILEAVFDGKIIPLYHKDILAEYDEVLHRDKFHLQEKVVHTVLLAIQQYGIEVFPQSTGIILADMDELIFYEVAAEKENEGAYLVTGNQRHFPMKDFIVTPAKMIKIIENEI